MQRSSGEIAPDCRSCFDVPALIAELAIKQATYWEIANIYERSTDVRASIKGKEYTALEDKMLYILELATFCQGRVDERCGIARYIY